jgi:restriction system protein
LNFERATRMGRRKKSSPLEDITGLIALLPWWAAVALGVASYFILHTVAGLPAVGAVRPGEIPGMGRPIVIGLATAGQYIAPIVCFVAAVMSVMGRRRREELVANVAAAETPAALSGMHWSEFEKLVGEAFRLQGYHVTETGNNGPDGGIDLVLRKGQERFLVQCKQWKAFKVGVQVVRELYGLMAAHGAAGGFVMTSGRFTEEATAFADGRNVTLVDGPKLLAMIKAARKSASNGSATVLAPRVPQEPVTAEPAPSTARPVETPQATGTPSCPVCSRAMTMRTAKRGANAGGTFWGCTSYPACRGVRTVS